MPEPGEYSLSTNRDGTVTLDWPDGRPETVLISSTMLEEWVAQRNEMTEIKRAIAGKG